MRSRSPFSHLRNSFSVRRCLSDARTRMNRTVAGPRAAPAGAVPGPYGGGSFNGRAQVAKWNRPYQTTKLKRARPPSTVGTNWRDVRILSLVMTMPTRMQIG